MWCRLLLFTNSLLWLDLLAYQRQNKEKANGVENITYIYQTISKP